MGCGLSTVHAAEDGCAQAVLLDPNPAAAPDKGSFKSPSAAGDDAREPDEPASILERRPHRPAVPEVEVGHTEMGWWLTSGGKEVEAVLESGAIALLDAQWMVDLAQRGGVLRPRQALPDEAFLSLSMVQASTYPGKWHQGLSIVCVSHCWLQPDHPDPAGHNLRLIASGLQPLLRFLSGRRVAVFYDYCCIHQKCRAADGTPQSRLVQSQPGQSPAVGRIPAEDELFQQALGSLGMLYSHPHLYVFMITAFPPDYEDPAAYTRSGNVAPYFDRGWCFCESSWAMGVKSSDKLLDLGKENNLDVMEWHTVRELCAIGRKVPLLPADFDAQMQTKGFTNGSTDRPRVAALYRSCFDARFNEATTLDYRKLRWGVIEAEGVARLLRMGVARWLAVLILSQNQIGDLGAQHLASALPFARTLQELHLDSNSIGNSRATALANALPQADRLARLGLSGNSIGDAGVRAIAAMLPRAPNLKKLHLGRNHSVGADATKALQAAWGARGADTFMLEVSFMS
jgi:hypothetical protein